MIFVHDLKHLLSQAILETDGPTRQQLPHHQFLAGLLATVSKRLRATVDIDDLEKMVERATLLLTLEQNKRVATLDTAPHNPDVTSLQQQIAALSEQVAPVARLLCPSFPRSRSYGSLLRTSHRCQCCGCWCCTGAGWPCYSLCQSIPIFSRKELQCDSKRVLSNNVCPQAI